MASRELVVGTATADLAHCRATLKAGSKRFATAARLLPAEVRDAATVFYAFCRIIDDTVDLGSDPHVGVATVRARVARLYTTGVGDDPIDRAMQRLVTPRVPRTVIDALVEGLSWDAEARRYDTLAELLAYCTRVASTVGVAMSVLMDVRDRTALARACDLGAAMQLTNIARDVGEDARRGRIYLPLRWFSEEGIDPDAFLATPTPSPGIRRATRRLLDAAAELYPRGEAGIDLLPERCRASIRAACRIYADIGRVIARADHDSVTRRAVVGTPRKLWLALLAALHPGVVDPDSRWRAPLPQASFLVEAAAS